MYKIAPERLQKIKKRLEVAVDDFDKGVPPRHQALYDIKELLAAVEQAQAELAGRKESNKRYHKQVCDKEDERRITRKRLDKVEEQLAECRAEVERLRKTTPVKIRDARISTVDLGTEQA